MVERVLLLVCLLCAAFTGTTAETSSPTTSWESGGIGRCRRPQDTTTTYSTALPCSYIEIQPSTNCRESCMLLANCLAYDTNGANSCGLWGDITDADVTTLRGSELISNDAIRYESTRTDKQCSETVPRFVGRYCSDTCDPPYECYNKVRHAPAPPAYSQYRYRETGRTDEQLCVTEMEMFTGENTRANTPARLCSIEPPPCAVASSAPENGADKSFDTDFTSKGWCAAHVSAQTGQRGYGWLAYRFPEPTTLTRLVMHFHSAAHSAHDTAYIEGSNDGEHWDTIVTLEHTHYPLLDVDVVTTAPRTAFPTMSPTTTAPTENNVNSVVGDPFAMDKHGNKIQFYLPPNVEKNLLDCGPVALWGTAKDAGLDGDTQQWFNSFTIKDGGVESVKVTIRKPSDASLGSAVQKAGATTTTDPIDVIQGGEAPKIMNNSDMFNLTTIDVQVEGSEMPATFTVSYNGFEAEASQNRSNPIGAGYSERLQYSHGTGISFEITSAVAKKYKSTTLQLMHLHLDLKVSGNLIHCSGGILAEIWGMVPMSKATTQLLQAPETSSTRQMTESH